MATATIAEGRTHTQRTQWSELEKSRALKLIEEGSTLRGAGRELGIPWSTLRQWILRAKKATPQPETPPEAPQARRKRRREGRYTYSNEIRDRAISAVNSGMKITAATKRFHIGSRGTIYHWLQQRAAKQPQPPINAVEPGFSWGEAPVAKVLEEIKATAKELDDYRTRLSSVVVLLTELLQEDNFITRVNSALERSRRTTDGLQIKVQRLEMELEQKKEKLLQFAIAAPGD